MTACADGIIQHHSEHTVSSNDALDCCTTYATQPFYPAFLPQEHKPNSPIRYYPDSTTGLTDPKFLLRVYQQDDYLAEHAHQVGEYEQELMEEVIKAVDFEGLGINPHIMSTIIHSSFLHRDYKPFLRRVVYPYMCRGCRILGFVAKI